MDKALLYELFSPLADGATPKKTAALTKADFYLDGLSGQRGAEARRAALARAMALPPDMTANALLEAINLLYTQEEYRAFIDSIKRDETLSD